MSKIRQRLEARQPLWVNWYVDEYIGGGASSEVYKLSERRFNQVSAVKVISWNSRNMPAFSTSSTYNTLKEYRSRAESEIRAMYELQNCPYIVHCKNHDFWDYYDEDMNLIGFDVLIQMDFWDCFQEKLLENEFNTDEKEILKFAKNITSALVAAHSKGIIHRDIKPENIFIDNSGNYLLGDFGVSKQAENNMLSTTTGTKPFMAPEIFNRKKYDKSVDIYSLGIVLYMLLNDNRLPFVTEVMSFNEVQDAVYDRMNGKPLDPPCNGSDELKRIVLKCCEFKAEDRYATASELFDDLNRLDMLQSGYVAPYANKPENKPEVVSEAKPTETEKPVPAPSLETEEKVNIVPDTPAPESDDESFETYYAKPTGNTETSKPIPDVQEAEKQTEKVAETAENVEQPKAESNASAEDYDGEEDFETVYAPSAKSAETSMPSPAPQKAEPVKEAAVSVDVQPVKAEEKAAPDSEDETFETVYAASKTDISDIKPKTAAEPTKNPPKAKKSERKKAAVEKKEKPAKIKVDKKASEASKSSEAEKPKNKSKAKTAAILSAAAIVAAGGITGAVLYANRDAEIVVDFEEEGFGEEGKVFNVYAWNGEFKNFFEKYFTAQIPMNGKGDFFEYAPGKKYFDEGVKFNWIIYTDEDGYYKRKLDEALSKQATAPANEKIDLFLTEADNIIGYVNSDYTMDVSKLGIRQLSTEYGYTVDAARSYDGVLKGVSFQCCPSAVIYRRSIAKDVLGTDDPTEVQKRLSTWEKFDEVAALAKENGYYMTASYADTYRIFSNNIATPWVNSDYRLTIPASVDKWIDQAKLYSDNEYTMAIDPWSDEKNAQMRKNGNTMCFIGPSWYISSCMEDAKECSGDWAICYGPQAHFWGGTWLLAAEGTDNPRLIADVMKAFTSNEDVCTALVYNENQFSNNRNVNMRAAQDPDYKNDFLGGQNDMAIFAQIAYKVNFDNRTEFDAFLNDTLVPVIGEYCNGWHPSRLDSIGAFRGEVEKVYPFLR